MQNYTRTRDDQAVERGDPDPYKPFPNRPYFRYLHELWMRERFLFVEKSRTMMLSWWGAAECLHFIMTRQPGKCIFWADVEDHALVTLDYCKVLYSEQPDWLKNLFPLRRALEKQPYNKLIFKHGGRLVALPGGNPSRIKSEHPTIVMMDEACAIKSGGPAFDEAVSTRVPRFLAVSSAAPSWFRELTTPAVPEEMGS
jgi:hypothetical protein